MSENFKKQQRDKLLGGRSRLPLPRIADPKARILVLVVLLVVLVGIFVGLRNYAEAPGSGPKPDVPSTEIGISGVERFSGIPSLDPTIAERVRDTGPTARRDWEPQAVTYLLLEARHTPSVHAYNRNLLPITPESAEQIDKDSRPWRFKFVRFRGELEYIREESYEDQYGGAGEIGRIHRGRVRVGTDPESVRVVFLTPYGPAWSDPNSSNPVEQYRAIEDGWVRGRGILVKNFVEEEDGREVKALLVVATTIERDYETKPVERLEDIPFNIIVDDPSLVDDPHRRKLLFKNYPLCMFRLIRYAESRAGEAGKELREKEGLKPKSFDTPQMLEELTGQPDRFRTHYYGGLGALSYRPVLHGPETTEANDAGVDEYLHGWISTDRNRLFQFVAPVALAGDWKTNDRIRYEGYFYKTDAYPSRGGTDRYAPMFVLTVLEKVPAPKPDYTGQMIIAAAFIVGIALLVFIIVREDKTKEDYRRWRRKRVVAG